MSLFRTTGWVGGSKKTRRTKFKVGGDILVGLFALVPKGQDPWAVALRRKKKLHGLRVASVSLY